MAVRTWIITLMVGGVVASAGCGDLYGADELGTFGPTKSAARSARCATVDCIADPSSSGRFTVTEAVYGAPGLVYSSSAWSSAYEIFEDVAADWQTRQVDISAFGDIGDTRAWPFDPTEVPLNGVVRIPEGEGPFPLVVIIHGKATPATNSTLGFDYLLDLLSSHGIISASVDTNFCQASSGDPDSRTVVLLEHVAQFRRWNGTPGHPLHGRVDTDNVMLVGHSRGAEAVGHASYLNQLSSIQVPAKGAHGGSGLQEVRLDGTDGLGPYGFGLSAIVALAPTAQWVPEGGVQPIRDSYFLFQGNLDENQTRFVGQRTYDLALPIDLTDPSADAEGTKALLWLYGGTHASANAAWPDPPPEPDAMPADQQRDVLAVWIGAIAQSHVLGHSAYEQVLRDHRVAWSRSWLPRSALMVSQYQGPQRVFVNHYEQTDDAVPSPPLRGSVVTKHMSSMESYLYSGEEFDPYQETHGVRLSWSDAARGRGSYSLEVDPASLVRGDLQVLSMRVGQSARVARASGEPLNDPDRMQDFSVVVSDGARSHAVLASDFVDLPFPARILDSAMMSGPSSPFRTVMQSLRIPLAVFADRGVDVDAMTTISLRFDQPQLGTATVAGELFLDDIQLTR